MCIKKPFFSDDEQKTGVVFIFRVKSGKIEKKLKVIILELNCDAPLEGLIANVHVCKSNKPI